MLLEIRRRLDGQHGCNLLDVRGFHVLNYRDEAVLRFKKVDSSGRHSAYQTDQQKEFDDQKTIPGIPPAAVRLTCGYQNSPSGDAIERIIIARPMGRSILWTSQVTVIDAAADWVDITPERLPGTGRVDFRRRGLQ
jgi:hypothetical protein